MTNKSFIPLVCVTLSFLVQATTRAGLSNPCATTPCLNGGMCVPIGPVEYECRCRYLYVGSRCQFATSPDEDIDSDGIPSGWENDNGLAWNVTNPQGSDADFDTFTDLEEFWADTSPTNPASFFPRVEVTNAPPGIMSIVIPETSVSRVYNIVENTNSLSRTQFWTAVGPWRSGTGGALTFTVTNLYDNNSYRTAVSYLHAANEGDAND